MDRLRFWRNQQRTARHAHIQDPRRRRRRDLHTIDNAGFQWRVVFVAGVGFFADGYTLFSSNFALPMIGYVYWAQDRNSDHQTGINSVTLSGCIVGQIVLGILADIRGRKKLYGWELAILIASSLGVAMSSAGESINGESSMRITAWLLFVRFVAGVGIGADYPLTAVITAEYAPRVHRARMMATVFLMQSLGQLFAAVVSIIAISTVPNRFSHPRVAVDSMWRWIYGVGAIFPAIALLLRMTIPESPRFTFDVLNNTKQATNDTGVLLKRVFRRRLASPQDAQAPVNQQQNGQQNGQQNDQQNGPENGQENGPENRLQDRQADVGQANADVAVEHDFPPRRSWDDLVHYLFICGNWRYLLGTMGTWFLMDFAFFGLGLNNPQIVSLIWNGEASFTDGQPPSWYSDPSQFKESELPYNDFRNTATHSLIIVSIGAVIGSLILVWLVNHFSRKRQMVLGFIALAILFFVVGGIFSSTTYSSGSHIIVAVFYGLCQLLFNLGPNGLTFMYPAEIFPTRYRCSLYGFSAAAGKLGSVIAQGALSRIQFDRRTGAQQEPQSFGHVLLAFGAVMLLGAMIAFFFLPEVQQPGTRQSIGLEQLAEGRPPPVSNGDLEMQRGARRRRGSNL